MELLPIFAWLVIEVSFSDSLFAEPVRFEPAEIDLADVRTDRVRGDKCERLAFERVMRNRKERMYASKVDYLIDIKETSNIFSGQYEFQPILFLITIIFVIMLTAYNFENMFGLNSYFQKLLTTVNNITTSINILLPILLPSTKQAATITHGDAKLHVNYSDLLMYMIQIIIIMIIFKPIVWICIQIWNCINTRNLGKLYEKLNVMQVI